MTEFSADRPTDWRPGQVRNPAGLLDTHFTDEAAWELIASSLEGGHPVEAVALRKPSKELGDGPTTFDDPSAGSGEGYHVPALRRRGGHYLMEGSHVQLRVRGIRVKVDGEGTGTPVRRL